MRPATSSVEPEYVPSVPVNTNPKVVSPLGNSDTGIGRADFLAHLRPDSDWKSEEVERNANLADPTVPWKDDVPPVFEIEHIREQRLYASGASTYVLDNVSVVDVGQARNGRWVTFVTTAATYLWFGQVGGGVFDPAGAFILPVGFPVRVPVRGRVYARGVAGAASLSLIEEARV